MEVSNTDNSRGQSNVEQTMPQNRIILITIMMATQANAFATISRLRMRRREIAASATDDSTLSFASVASASASGVSTTASAVFCSVRSEDFMGKPRAKGLMEIAQYKLSLSFR